MVESYCEYRTPCPNCYSASRHPDLCPECYWYYMSLNKREQDEFWQFRKKLRVRLLVKTYARNIEW